MISQREAYRLRKRVLKLEQLIYDQRSRWSADWPNGEAIGSVQLDKTGRLVGSVLTARKLRHAVVATADDNGLVRLYALPQAEIVP